MSLAFVFPASFAQSRLWILDQLNPHDPTYNIPLRLQIRGALNVEALEQSLNDVVQRHEALRTTFGNESGGPVQVIAPVLRVNLPVIDLEGIPDGLDSSRLEEQSFQEARRPFDLGQGPLLRATLLRLSATEWVLLLTVHHIVSDAWSLGILNRDLAAYYAARVTGRPADLPALQIQYADYAGWQRSRIEGSFLEEQLAYWRRQLADAPTVLALPSDRPRPAVQTFQGASVSLRISPELTAKIRRLSREEEATPFMILLAAFQLLLARYSGQEDILVGTPVAGRTREELEGLVGFFVNTLALRTQLDGNPSFRELVRRVREVALGAFTHQELPFERLVEELRPDRSASHTPLVQVSFALDNVPRKELVFPGLEIRTLRRTTAVSRYDLAMTLIEVDDEFVGQVEYSTDLFDRQTIQRMIEHFGVLLERVVAGPDRLIRDFSLMSDQERQLVVEEWNKTEVDYPRRHCVHELFAAQAAETPDALAVTCGMESITYGDLDRRSNQLARYLKRLGVGPEVLVGLCLERSIEWVISIMGILKAGGAHVPLDPTYPVSRLKVMIEDSAPPVLITSQRFHGQLPEIYARLVLLDLDSELIGAESSEAIRAGTTLDNAVYVTYTSGSTGLPKGVVTEHRGLLNLVLWHRRTFGITPSDRALQICHLGLDGSNWELWSHLTAGASVHIIDDETRLSSHAVFEWILRQRITIGFLPPVLAESILFEKWPVETCLRYLLTGSDRVVVYPPEGLPFTYVNLYGPTECTVLQTAAVVAPRRDAAVPPSIGRPLSNLHTFVLDPSGQPAPIGIPGELYLGGEGVTRGYLNRPELTADKFVPDFYSGKPGARLYRTGDLVRWCADGQLEFLGRLDNQVKIRGFRIELGEVEAILAQHPAVHEAAVVARETESGRKRLIAYVVLKGQDTLMSITDLRMFLSAKMPDYMVPSAFVLLDKLPLSPQGKVDRQALPMPDETRPIVGAVYEGPRTQAEHTFANIWGEILGVARVGIHDNFFELGGDSILAIRVIARANERGLNLTPRQLFQHQTIAELAAVAGEAHPVEAEQGLVVGPTPLTAVQAWFFEEDFAEPLHWNQAVFFSVREPVDHHLLAQAIQHLIRHHDALRMRFDRHLSGWKQTEAEGDTAVPLSIVDLASLSGDKRRAALAQELRKHQTSLQWEALVRFVLFELGGQERPRLLIIAHHLIIDNISWGVLREDLESIYRQLAHGDPIQLPAKTSSFQAWSRRVQMLAQSPDFQSELSFWLSSHQSPLLSLPVDREADKPANTVGSSRTVSVGLDAEETRTLIQQLPSAYKTQINDVLLAALVEAMTPWTGRRSLSIDLEGHGRESLFDDLDLSRTVGWFSSSFPIHLHLEGIESPDRVLAAVREQLRSIPNRGVGFGILRYLGPEVIRQQLRTLERPQLSFNYLGQSTTAVTTSSLFEPGPESVGLARSPMGVRPYLIEINALVSRGRLRVHWRYSKSFHRRSTIQILAQGFLAALRRYIAASRMPAVTYRPSARFPMAGLDDSTLVQLAKDGDHIEDVYPLSPIQQGILFQSLYASRLGVYVTHWMRLLQEELDLRAFRLAWQRIMDRYAVLRTAFLWEGLEEPHQVVYRGMTLPWEEIDWRLLTTVEQESRLRAHLEADQRRGFDLKQAPLMRLAVIRMGEQRYQIVWTLHHLIIDGWSIPPVFDELLTLYDAIRDSHAAVLEEPRPFRDYIYWLGQQNRQGEEEFWRKRLAGFLAPTPLAMQGDKGGTRTEGKVEAQELTLPADSRRALRAFSRQDHLTLNTILQGMWALVLSRYSGEKDILFGAVVSGRSANIPGIASMVGLLMNTLPIRVQVSPNEPVRAWLRQLQEEQSEARQYEHTSPLDVQSWSQIPHGVPLFESVLVFENYPDLNRQNRGEGVDRTRIGYYEQTYYPLTVWVFPGTELVIRISYDTNRFDTGTIARMLGHLKTLLEGVALHPEQPLGALPMLTATERDQILYQWNDTRRDYAWDSSLMQRFALQVIKTPDAVAFRFEDQALSYRELDARATRVAYRLRSLGVGPEIFVGLCLERSLLLPVGLVGILKAGGVYVPLDPEYPKERLALMVEDTRPRVVLTQRHLTDRLPTGTDQIWLDADDQDPGGEKHLEVDIIPGNLAYVMFTSGSTGRPKGSALPHRQLLNRFSWMWEAFPFTPDDVICQKTSINFVDSVWELLGPLLHGLASAIVPDSVYRDLDRFVEALAHYQVTRVWLLPSVLAQLLDYANLAARLPRLKYWVMGGEVLSADLVRQFHRQLPGRVLLNLYGSSELFDATACVVDESACAHGYAPIGRPIANTRTYVLDEHLELVPVGVTGELYVGGFCLPRGYLQRPELTAERFLPDPFHRNPGARLFKTGDLARYRADGTLECLGRRDHQVKFRGYRIELGEIEAVLLQHPHLSNAAVVLREDEPGAPYLAGYVIVAPGQTVSASDMRQFLRQWLPEYMVPASYVCLETLPYTPSGKIDRRALPVPDLADRADLMTLFVEPRSPTERILAAIFADLLHLARVGVDDNFFELGGHSLLALRVISRVREELDVELPIRAFFDAPTVSALARQIGLAGAAVPMVARQARTEALPLSFAQQRLWFLDQLFPGNSSYNLNTALHLRGALDAGALEYSLKDVVARHETLRTRFVVENGDPKQWISTTLEITLTHIDLEGQIEAMSKALQMAESEINRPFDLGSGPLIRALLVRLSEGEYLLVLTIHHSISDGWSLDILKRDLAAYYAARVTGRPVDLPELPIQYADYAIWQRNRLQGPVLEEQLAYWRRQLADAPVVLAFPTDRPRPAVPTLHGASVDLTLSATLTERIRSLGREEEATPFMTLLAAFQLLLARHSGQEDILVGTPVAGRTRAELEGLIGFFVNTLVLRTKLDGNPSFRALVRRVREVALGAFTHQDLPFEKLVEELRPERSLERNPLFQILINYVNTPNTLISLPNMSVELADLANHSVRFPLTLYIHDHGSEIDLRLLYQDELYSSRRMQEIMDQFHALLAQVGSEPHKPIDSFSLITPGAERVLPDPRMPLVEQHYASVPALFLDWARRRSDLPAIRQHGTVWTYGDIAASVGGIVRLVAPKRNLPGTVIAVAGARTPGYITGMMAVLLSGATLLTLDSRLPAKRRRQMLRQARCQWILNTEEAAIDDESWFAESQIRVVSWQQPAPGDCVPALTMDEMDAISAQLSADDAAYVFFTSGTTGIPKGIVGCHKGLAHFLAWQRDRFGIGPQDVSAQLTGMSFDVVLRDVFLPLTSGAALCLPDDPDDLGGDHILPWLEREQITLLHTVPAIAAAWLATAPSGVPLRSLRQVFFAGEPLSDGLVTRWRARFPESGQLANLYGPTETSLAKLCYEIPGEVLPGIQPIGWPLPETQALVLAATGQLCGLGEQGEIVIRTPYRSLGYIDPSPSDRARFVRNPFRDDPADLLYHTGDRGRYGQHGVLEILGRMDDQIKIRGIRVEPGEVGAVLAQHPTVRDCLVLPYEKGSEHVLVAYVVPNGSQAVTNEQLRDFLSDYVPSYILPATIMLMEHFPLTANGKVDRQALPVPNLWAMQEKTGQAPMTHVEELLAEIWKTVLGISNVGIHDNFFELGGHSLLATQVMWRVRDRFRIDLPLRILFEAPTIARLGAALDKVSRERQPQDLDSIVTLPRTVQQVE